MLPNNLSRALIFKHLTEQRKKLSHQKSFPQKNIRKHIIKKGVDFQTITGVFKLWRVPIIESN